MYLKDIFFMAVTRITPVRLQSTDQKIVLAMEKLGKKVREMGEYAPSEESTIMASFFQELAQRNWQIKSTDGKPECNHITSLLRTLADQGQSFACASYIPRVLNMYLREPWTGKLKTDSPVYYVRDHVEELEDAVRTVIKNVNSVAPKPTPVTYSLHHIK